METLEQEAEEKKIHITTVDRCVMCGEIVPEGQQVCGLCKYKIETSAILELEEMPESCWQCPCIQDRTSTYSWCGVIGGDCPNPPYEKRRDDCPLKPMEKGGEKQKEVGSRKVKLEIEIDEAYIAELVSQEIARRIVETHGYENREARYGIREGVDKAVKQYIYSKKDAIIDRVVDRATVEIVKKGLPRLLEKIATDAKEATP